MKYEKWIFRFSLVLNVLVVLPFAILCCLVLYMVWGNWHSRQLIPFKATGWQLEAGTHTGNALSVKPYKTRGQGQEGEVFYLHVAGGDDTPLSEWFSIALSEDNEDLIIRCPPVRTSPSPRLANWNPGIEIMSGKDIPVIWWLSYTGDKVVFSNQTFFVSATQENSGRPPASVHKVSWTERIDNTPPEWDGVMGLNLTLFDPHFEEEGWAVYISIPFRDSRDIKTVPHPAGLVLANTNDVTAVASRTIYIDAGQNVGFRPQRVRSGLTNGLEQLKFKVNSFIP